MVFCLKTKHRNNVNLKEVFNRKNLNQYKPVIATVPLDLVVTTTVTSDIVCPGVGITFMSLSILNGSPENVVTKH